MADEHDPHEQPQPEQPAAICGPDTYSPLIIGGEDRPLPFAEDTTWGAFVFGDPNTTKKTDEEK